MPDNHTVTLIGYCKDMPSLLASVGSISPDELCDLVVVADPAQMADLDRDALQAAWRPAGAVHLLTVDAPASDVAVVNAGLAWCADQGYRYAARMCPGDLSRTGRIAAQSSFLDTHPDVVLVGGCVDLVDDHRASGIVVRFPEHHEQIVARMRITCPVSDGALMLRLAAVQKVGGYPTSFPGAADYALLWRLLEAGGRFANLPDVLVAQRIPRAGAPPAVRYAELRSRLRLQRTYRDGSWRGRYGIARTRAVMAVPQSALMGAKRLLLSEDVGVRHRLTSPPAGQFQPSTTAGSPGALRIGLLPPPPERDITDAVIAAVDFCQRGPTVRLAPPSALMRSGDLTGYDAVFDLAGRAEGAPGLPLLVLTDAVGAPVSASAAVVDAVRQHSPWIEVQVRDGLGSVLATGTVGTLRSVAATRSQMLRAAGPLLVIAARSFPLPAAVAPDVLVAPVTATPSATAMADVAGTARFAGRLVRRVLGVRQWQVARLRIDPDHPTVAGGAIKQLRWHSAPNINFWADPHVVVDGVRAWMLVEELDMTVGRGAIRLLELDGDDLAPHGIVLRTDHHLSYPQTYRTPGGWLGTVETCAAFNPIYRFDHLGAPWQRAEELPALPPHLADPVLLFDDDGAEVVGVLGTDAQLDPDSVVVAYRLDRAARNWRRDDGAVRVSVINGRGGGTLDTRRRIRATQDCAGRYGRGVELIRFPETDPPEVLWRLDGAEHAPAPEVAGRRQSGMHTLSWADGAGRDGDETIVWCDGWHTRPTARGWLWDLSERQHLEQCQG